MVNPYGNLLEESVLTASPMELTSMLFEKLLSEVRNARACLRSGNVAQRSMSAGKAVEVVVELAGSLDDERGGELSRSLRRLYAYVVEQLNEGNGRQEDRGFANAEEVIEPLAEAWRQLADSGNALELQSGSLPGWSGDSLAVSSLSYSG